MLGDFASVFLSLFCQFINMKRGSQKPVNQKTDNTMSKYKATRTPLKTQ